MSIEGISLGILEAILRAIRNGVPLSQRAPGAYRMLASRGRRVEIGVTDGLAALTRTAAEALGSMTIDLSKRNKVHPPAECHKSWVIEPWKVPGVAETPWTSAERVRRQSQSVPATTVECAIGSPHEVASRCGGSSSSGRHSCCGARFGLIRQVRLSDSLPPGCRRASSRPCVLAGQPAANDGPRPADAPQQWS